MDTTEVFTAAAKKMRVQVVENGEASPEMNSHAVVHFSIRWIVPENMLPDVDSSALEFDCVAFSRHKALFALETVTDEGNRNTAAEAMAAAIVELAEHPVSVGWHFGEIQPHIDYMTSDNWQGECESAVRKFRAAAADQRKRSQQASMDAQPAN